MNEEALYKVFDWIDAHKDEALQDLQRLCRQPSISAQKVGLEECADLVVDLMKESGLEGKAYPLNGGPPCVIGLEPSSQNEKVLLGYAHYDVQPPEPLEKWTDPPFSAVIKDGRLWARGATDNKSGVLAFIKAAKAFKATVGELPVGVRFLFEGEEEIGSPHLGEFVKANPELFAADAMHCLDGGVNASEDVPEVELGLKSVFYVELVAEGSNRDIHSLNAPLVPQPAWELVRALNTLVDENRNILIDGWYDGIYQLGEEEESLLRENAERLDLEKIKQDLGIEDFALGRTGYEALRAREYEPTCNICGLTSGYQGPGSKTIVPGEARAKIDFRIIPMMDPSKAYDKLRKHLDSHGFSHIKIHVEFPDPEPPYKISVKEDISQSVIKAATRVFGKAPVVKGVSAEGTILRHVWMPTTLTGFAQVDCNLHAPNENIDIDHYINGIKYAASIMWEYGNSTK